MIVVADSSPVIAAQWPGIVISCNHSVENCCLTPRFPRNGATGGYLTLSDCARGLVSEACGGNLVDYG
jgi:hypothetical protein